MVIKQAARARILTRSCEFGAFFVAHLSEGFLGRSGEARGPKFKKTIFEIDEFPNLLHPLIYFIRGLLLTTGGYMLRDRFLIRQIFVCRETLVFSYFGASSKNL